MKEKKITRKLADVKCPKCGSKTFTLKDFTLLANHRYVENGKWDQDTIIEPEGFTGKVVAECHGKNCDHIWRLKNVVLVTDFDEITD